MWHIFCVLLLWASAEARPRPVRHAHPPGGLHTASTTASSWVCDIRLDNAGRRAPLPKLDLSVFGPLIERDGCTLLRSNADAGHIWMEIYCGDTTERPLEGLMDALAAHYGIDNLALERNRHMEHKPPHATEKRGTPGGLHNAQEWATRPKRPRATQRGGTASAQSVHALYTQTSPTWGLDRIDQQSLPLNGEYGYDTRGEDVDVYIVDTGIHTAHVQFEGRASFYYNAIDALDYDCLGHGTHVAGIVGAALYGVAKRANLIAVKVLDCSGIGSTFTILDGLRAVLERIAETGRRSVINLSLGGDRSNLLDNALLAIAQYNNTAVVVAAGNDGADACNYSPSNLGSAGTVLSVGASDANDVRPYWSNVGACVDLSAPGVAIQSAWIGASNTSTAVLSGTSMAAPFVAGVCALVLGQQPSMSIAQVNSLITGAAWPNKITSATQSGGGRRLLYARINASAPTPPPTRAPTRSPVQPNTIPWQQSSAGGTSLTVAPLLLLTLYALLFS